MKQRRICKTKEVAIPCLDWPIIGMQQSVQGKMEINEEKKTSTRRSNSDQVRM